jgi:hypothetical protein
MLMSRQTCAQIFRCNPSTKSFGMMNKVRDWNDVFFPSDKVFVALRPLVYSAIS